MEPLGTMLFYSTALPKPVNLSLICELFCRPEGGSPAKRDREEPKTADFW